MMSCKSLYFCRHLTAPRWATSIMLHADNDPRIKDAGGGFQRVNRRIDTHLGDIARQHDRRRVQMGERGRRRGVGQVVRRNVNRLHGRDGAVSWWR